RIARHRVFADSARRGKTSIDILEAACTELVETSSQGQDCSYIRPGYRRRHVERHIVYYRIEPFGVAIIRILHYRQDVLRHL
ncbi:type II toxin-antitoxin system RelE/ParE family toxin, partial [Nitrosomonas sp.]|uniref:type II toxin-antitoxin system RelE/ParE family toxin n=1 Tax=Nitrosomonas sp. TaxID=42353 RepID=UPI0037C50BF9